MLVFQLLEAGIALVGQGGEKNNTIVFNVIPLLIILPIGASIFYTSYFSLNFFLKKPFRFVWIIGGYILFITLISLPGYLSAKAGHKEIDYLRGLLATTLFVSPILYFNVFGFLFRTFIEWVNDKKIKAELEKDKLTGELELLKSKINPHFLFNTINNIDVLIEKDSTRASQYLNKLSDIMRFMLYETKEEKITLESELSYIKKYIDLQKIRSSNPDYIKYNITGDAGNLMIAPTLYIPFIENAFKHSESNKTNNAISINFSIDKEKIIFECENYYVKRTSVTEDGGLGIELMKKRLNLTYPEKHNLEITDSNNKYKVRLSINEI